MALKFQDLERNGIENDAQLKMSICWEYNKADKDPKSIKPILL